MPPTGVPLHLQKAKGLPIPSADTIERRIKSLGVEVRVLARQGEEALARLYPAQRRSRAELHALEWVNADGHKFDVFTRFEDGRIGRPVMLAFQDIYSGKVLAWRIDETEHSGLVRLCIGDVVDRYGIMVNCLLDNGRGFASKWITGGTKTRYRFKVREEDPNGILTDLGVNVSWATPFHGQSKPIERAFRDMCEDIAKHPFCVGAYTGNSPDAKPENYGQRAIPIADFKQHVDQGIAEHNSRLGRRGGVCKGRSLDQVFAESYAISTIRKATAEQRRRFMLASELVKARFDGSLWLDNNRFWHTALPAYIGQQLVLRFDPENLHQSAHVYTPGGEWICEAENDGFTGFADKGAAREHSRARNEFVRRTKQSLAAQRRMTAAEVAAQLPGLTPPTQLPSAKVIAPVFPTTRTPEVEADRKRLNGLLEQQLADMQQRRMAEGF